MNILCQKPPSLCFDPADPTLPGPSSLFPKYSSEDPDVDIFFGRNYRPFPDYPPLGSVWYAIGCVGWCVSTVSQEDANNCAQRQAADCISHEWPILIPRQPNSDDPPDTPPFIPVPRTLFPNQTQSESFTCPDGSLFTFTVPFGTFLALTQTAANLMAESYALKQATANRLCFGDLSNDALCVGQEQETRVSVSSGHTPLTFTILSGAVPGGMLTQQTPNQFIISGIPSAAGTYTFVLQAQDSQGHLMQKSYTLYVEGIANTSLPAATVGTPYSATLLSDGPTLGDVTWQVLVGTLPAGLTLNINTGVISGTPTTQGSSNITVLMTDLRVDCQKQFTIAVTSEAPGPVWSSVTWEPFAGCEGTCSFPICSPDCASSATAIGGSANAMVQELACCGAVWSYSANNIGVVKYKGPACNCRILATFSCTGSDEDLWLFVQISDTSAPALVDQHHTVAGEYQADFTIPDTGGLELEYMIMTSTTVNGAFPDAANQASSTAVFQNV